MERLLGHAVHFAMLKRELLSIFPSLYDFVAKSYNRRQRLWSSAAKEACWAFHLFRLRSVDMKKGWSTMTTASDASLSGIAVCACELSRSDVVKLQDVAGCVKLGYTTVGILSNHVMY